jgi:hypothetical protein
MDCEGRSKLDYCLSLGTPRPAPGPKTPMPQGAILAAADSWSPC